MDLLKDVLLARNLDQPSELKSIEDFLKRTLNEPFGIKSTKHAINIIVANGKVAYVVRSKLPELVAYAAPTRKIYISVHSTPQST